MALTVAEWTARAEEAQLALHKLLMGDRTVEVSSPDGTRVRYQETDQARLEAYVGYCKRQANLTAGSPGSPVYITP